MSLDFRPCLCTLLHNENCSFINYPSFGYTCTAVSIHPSSYSLHCKFAICKYLKFEPKSNCLSHGLDWVCPAHYWVTADRESSFFMHLKTHVVSNKESCLLMRRFNCYGVCGNILVWGVPKFFRTKTIGCLSSCKKVHNIGKLDNKIIRRNRSSIILVLGSFSNFKHFM